MPSNLGLLGVGAASEWTGTLVSDTFTDSNGTALASHTPTQAPAGSSWSNAVGTNEIQSDRAQPQSSTRSVSVINALYSDVTVGGDLTPVSGTPSPALVGRYTDSANNWIGAVDTAAGILAIYERIADSNTLRASAAKTWVNGTTYACTFAFTGSTLTLTGGAVSCQYTSTTGLTQTICGVSMNSTGCHIDNFLVTKP